MLYPYYKKAALYPSIIVFIVTVIFSIIDNYDYKSEWMTADYVILTSIVTGVIYCLLICLFSLTIFLNKYEQIKNNKLLTFLSWFLLPCTMMAMVFIHEINYAITFKQNLGDEFVFVLILNIPFLIGLIWSYLNYKTAIKMGII